MTRRPVDHATLEEMVTLRDSPATPVPVRKAAARAVDQLRQLEPIKHTCSRCGERLEDEAEMVLDSGWYRHRHWCVDVVEPEAEQTAADWDIDGGAA